jgi:hypothetical protein
MRLTPRVVGDVLEDTLGYRVPMDPHGFTLRSDDRIPRYARLRCGSGIAGKGTIWGLVQMPDGAPLLMGIDTRTKLVSAVLKFMAGALPPHLSEHTAPREK